MPTSLGLPAPSDVRQYLASYPGISVSSTYTLNGTLVATEAIITGINTSNLEPFMAIAGTGIPAGTLIVDITVVDPVNGTITISNAATQSGTFSLTITYFTNVDDNWITQRRDNFVIPYVQSKIRMTITGTEIVEEYYDGTGSSVLVLRRKPIISLINLSYTNVDSNLYYLTPSALQVITDEGILKAKANFNESTYTPIFWKGERNLRVTYEVGFATCPSDIAEAILYLLCERVLGHVANQTGGGNLSVQGYSRDYGKRGRYSSERNDLARAAYGILSPYKTGTV